MHHGDLSSSGGSVDSELPNLRRGTSNYQFPSLLFNFKGVLSIFLIHRNPKGESIGSVTTPTGPTDFGNQHRSLTESPLMMLGELDRLQSDMLSGHRLSNDSNATLVGALDHQHDFNGASNRPADSSLQHSSTDLRRRDSIQSRSSQISQQSRRERAEGFRRRRSASICSDRDRDQQLGEPYSSSPYNNSFDENDRTPVNEINVSMDMNDMTPDVTHAPFPPHQKSVSFEEDDNWCAPSCDLLPYITCQLFKISNSASLNLN